MASENLTELIVKLKAQNPDAGCRVLTRLLKEQYGIETSKDIVLHRLKRFRARNPLPTIKYEAPDIKPGMPFSEMMRGFSDVQEFRGIDPNKKAVVKCTIQTEEPIGLIFMSDLHIGSPYTDHEAIAADVQAIKEHPNLFCMLGGDRTDNFQMSFKDARAPANQLHPALQQKLAAEELMNELDGKIISCIGGNHDEMDAKKTGLDTEYFITRGKAFPYLPTGGVVEVTVGSQTYRILWVHDRMTGNSQLNIFNLHRWLRMLDPTATITVSEHEHNPGIMSYEAFEFGEQRTLYQVRTGTYKLNDPYSMRYFKGGRKGAQGLVLFPDRDKVVAMHGSDAIEDSKIYLRGVRG